MNDCLRHIDYALGFPANTMVVAGKYAAQTVYDYEKRSPSIVGRLRRQSSNDLGMH